jgi:hypothetical protein
MQYFLTILLLIVPAAPAAAQSVRFGIKGGIPFTDYFETADDFTSETRRYTVGPTMEIAVRNRLNIEIDVLYRRMNYTFTVRCGLPCFTPPAIIAEQSVTEVTGNSWDFPILAKFLGDGDRARPFVSAGFVARYIAPIDARGTTTFVDLANETTFQEEFEPDHPDRAFGGLAVAGGVEFGAGRLHVAPELRYTGWLKNQFGNARLQRNQFEILLGFTF